MNIPLNDYVIQIEEGLLSKINEDIKTFYEFRELFILTDENLFKLYEKELKKELKDFDLKFVVIPAVEQSKSLDTYAKSINELIGLGIKKNHLLIAFGGGVVGDLAGFIAATLYRGVPFIQIPTSLLAMVDSSIGSKTGIDILEGKNLIGAFKNPLKVYIDPLLLKTLPKVEYKNGLAEVIKAGLIGNKALYEYVKVHDTLTLEEIIMAIKVKVDIVKKDPFEKNERMFLNFGHTFGHAIERHYDYAIKHGVAISYGMLFSLEIGTKLGITEKGLYEEVKDILMRLELVKEPLLDKTLFTKYFANDKKNLADGLRFIFIEHVGQPKIQKGVKF